MSRASTPRLARRAEKAALPRSGRWSRERTAKALEVDDCGELADRLRSCDRYGVPFKCACGPGALRVALPLGCKMRVCRSCARRAAAGQALRWGLVCRAMLERPVPGYRLMLVTLTKRTERASVLRQERGPRHSQVWSESLRRFARNGRKLLAELYPKVPGSKWQGAGGLGVLELGAGYNWHLHAIVWGRYVPHAEIRERWAKLSAVFVCRTCGYEAEPARQGRRRAPSTRGQLEDRRGVRACPSKGCPRRGQALELSRSSIVDVRQIRKAREAVAYVTKYLSKPTPITRPSTESLVEWSLRGSRRVLTWGSLYNFPADPRLPGLGVSCIACRQGLRLDREYQQLYGWRVPLEFLYMPPPPGASRYVPFEMFRNGQTSLPEGRIPYLPPAAM